MRNKIHTINIVDIHTQAYNREISVSDYVNKLREILIRERKALDKKIDTLWLSELINGLTDTDFNEDWDEFDEWLSDFYDWADENKILVKARYYGNH